MKTTLWTCALAAGLLWPSRTLSAFDGVPLDGRTEAIVIGLAVPALWWLDRSFLAGTWARLAIVALLLVRLAGSSLAQEGLCARFSTAAPLAGTILTIPVEEPRGVLRSWDVRADWRADTPACTAVLDRPYRFADEFPTWFVNILDHLPETHDVRLDVTGTITVTGAGELTLQTGPDMAVTGRIGAADVSPERGADIRVPLAAGSHPMALHAVIAGDRMRFIPLWNDRSAWKDAFLTTTPPGAGAAWRASAIAWLTTAIVSALLLAWLMSAAVVSRAGAPVVFWTAAASLVLAIAGVTGRFERLAGLLLMAGVVVPVSARSRNLRTVFLMFGVPWLAFTAARSLPLIGHATRYSMDDWLAYQLSGARIFMHGYWLQGGTLTFDYQPLYRWISGLLHVVFGDSSVGELYLDAAALLAGALLAFALAKLASGFREGLVAAASTLATFTLGTIWYFPGRGLSETVAAGFAFLAAFFLLRARIGRASSAAAAGVSAVLMFYTRLNHALFAGFLVALLLPISARIGPGAFRRMAAAIRPSAAAIYGGVLTTGVALFALRTWWYTGVFSVLYGTSLRNNDTGLRPSTILTLEPWRKILHSLSALAWMNEPPRLDARALMVIGGLLVAAGAILQVPRMRTVPASLVAVIVGATASAFFVHTHNYPGRMSIHLVPFAAAAVAIAGGRMWHPR